MTTTTVETPQAGAAGPRLDDEKWNRLLEARATDPEAVARAYAARRRPSRVLSERGTLFLVAADHPARGALASGGDAMAMADRRSLLARLIDALGHPDVDGVLGSPDVVEELLLLGALEGKVVIGSMNRGGLDGASWTMDDRFTGYDAASIAANGPTSSRLESCRRPTLKASATVADSRLSSAARAATAIAGRIRALSSPSGTVGSDGAGRPVGMWPIGVAPHSKILLAAVAATTANNDVGSTGRLRAMSRTSTTTPIVTAGADQDGSVTQVWTARAARTRTLSAWTRTPRAEGTCCSAMMRAMPTVKPSTTGTGT